MGRGGEAGAVGWNRRYGQGAESRAAESTEMGGSIRATAFHQVRKAPRRQTRGTSGAPAFVEPLAAGAGTGHSCLVEVESRQGRKLRLELTGVATSQVATRL